MQQLDSYLADRALTRQLYLMRFSAGEQKKVLAVLVTMRAELVAKLRAGDVTDFARGRLKTLLKQCEAVIDHGYGQIQTTLDFEDWRRWKLKPRSGHWLLLASKRPSRPSPR